MNESLREKKSISIPFISCSASVSKHFPPAFSPTTPLFSCYSILFQFITFSPSLSYAIHSPSFKSANYLCFLLPASLGLFLKGKAQSLLYFIPDQNKMNNSQCLRMGSPTVSRRGMAFYIFPSSKVTGGGTRTTVTSPGLCLSPS